MMDAKYAKLSSIKLTLKQDEDCCGRVDTSEQSLEIETMDGGGGAYLVISTERWALDSDEDIDAFASRLKEVLRQFPPNTTGDRNGK
jgi:hypothetical protein